MPMMCPRCEKLCGPEEEYGGPCAACRAELRATAREAFHTKGDKGSSSAAEPVVARAKQGQERALGE